MIDHQARILAICKQDDLGARQLLAKLPWDHNRTHKLLSDMKKKGLVRFVEKKLARGRPLRITKPTQLGLDFIQTYNLCQMQALQINAHDVRQVLKQVALTNMLAQRGVDPYDRFIEMMELVENVGQPEKDRFRLGFAKT